MFDRFTFDWLINPQFCEKIRISLSQQTFEYSHFPLFGKDRMPKWMWCGHRFDRSDEFYLFESAMCLFSSWFVILKCKYAKNGNKYFSTTCNRLEVNNREWIPSFALWKHPFSPRNLANSFQKLKAMIETINNYALSISDGCTSKLRMSARFENKSSCNKDDFMKFDHYVEWSLEWDQPISTNSFVFTLRDRFPEDSKFLLEFILVDGKH